MATTTAAVPTRSRVRPVASEATILPAWPVLAMPWIFPITWALGLTVVPAAATLTLIMVAFMLRTRSALVVPGVGVLVAFIVWVGASAVMLDNAARAMGFTFRGLVLVSLVYAISARESLTTRAVVNSLTFLWCVVIVGGIAGMLFPDVRITTPVAHLLPQSLTANEYVRDLFQPPLAEVQQPYGTDTVFTRPSAPFPYANGWGVAILLLTPVAVACVLQARTWRTRGVLLVGAALMIPPAVASSNRGMFLALGAAAAYCLVRLAIRNRAAPVLSLGVVVGGAVVWVVSRGFLDQVAERQRYGQSNDARLTLYGETIRRTLESPLLGYGAPRPSVGQDLSVGTQGYMWTLMFSHGFIGLALFLLFLWGTTLRTWRAPGDVNLVLHAVLVVASGAILVYGLDIMQLLTIVLVAAVLLRNRYGLDGGD